MRPSSEIEMILSFHNATPRLLTPQQATSPAQARSVPGSNFHLISAFLAAGDVDGIDRAPAVGHVHHAVFDDRGGLQIAVLVAAAALKAAERHGECQPEVLDVLGVDLLELREPPAFVVAVMQQPVVRFLADVERALVGHVGRLHGRERSRREQRTRQSTGESQSLHGNPPVIAGASWPGNYSLLLASCISVDASPQCGKRSPVCNRRSISRRCMAGRRSWPARARCDAGWPERRLGARRHRSGVIRRWEHAHGMVSACRRSVPSPRSKRSRRLPL